MVSLTPRLRLLASAVGAFGLLATTPALPGTAQAQTVARTPTQSMEIATGRGRLVTLDQPMSDLFVADASVADVQVRSPTQLYVFAKKAGETTVYATAKGGAVVFSSTVRVGNNIETIDQMLAIAIPDAAVVATPMNGLVLLTGTVANPDDAAEAERLVKAFVGEETRVVSRLRAATPLQVNLQVRVAEVSRDFIKQVGVNLLTRDTTGGFQFGVFSGRTAGTIAAPDLSAFPSIDASTRFGLPAGSLSLPFDPATGNFLNPTTGRDVTFNVSSAVRTTIGLAGELFGLDILSAIDLGETTGQVTTLANPNITALSGETASFLAGGEIPIPLAQGLGTTTVEYKPYGVGLAFTPTVMSDGRISLRVRPEVSQLTSAGAVQLNGVTIPALTTRRIETSVELGSGQSMMIGGLLSNNHGNSVDKTPFLGDLPLIGSLFRSNRFQRSETELVIVITPYLVKPVDANRIALPTDGYRAPNDAQRLLLGQLQSGESGATRPVPTVAPPVGNVTPVPPGVAAATPAGRSGAVAPGFSLK